MDVSGGNDGLSKDRRPLKVRRAGFWIPLASRLRSAGVTPNTVSLIGLAVGVLSGVLLAATRFVDPGILQRILWLISALCILLRGGCNVLDGIIAVETGCGSPTGTLWNEVPDRISDVATLLGAGYAAGGAPVLGWLAAVIAVLIAYVRAQCRVAGAPMDFAGPMAKPMRMLFVSLAALWAGLAPPAWQPGEGAADEGGLLAMALALIIAGGIITIMRRLHRAARYLNGESQ
jgi:phosphatidylglycerophosphate synthase